MKYYKYFKDTPSSIWISKIPQHWTKKKIKYIFAERTEKGHPKEPLLVASQNMGVVPKTIYGNRTVEAQKDLHLLKLVIKYLAKSLPFISLLKLCVTGIREGQNIDYSKLKNFKIPIPPIEEQNQIVRFLDWKISSINKLINIKQKQIEELEALKRSKINDIVMGQITNIPQKETNVIWIKHIPIHWQELSLIQVAQEQLIKNTGMIEDNLLSLSYGKIINKDINTTNGLLPISFESYQIVFNGNIILRLTDLQNDHKSLRTGLVTQTGIITSAYTCLKVRNNILPEYLQLQLYTADLCKVFYGMGGGVRQSIGFKEIRKLLIAVPPINEQKQILDIVYKIEKNINHAMQKNHELIATLKELKNTLIADTVTGKIDVRDIKIPEYDFTDEEADFDIDEIDE